MKLLDHLNNCQLLKSDPAESYELRLMSCGMWRRVFVDRHRRFGRTRCLRVGDAGSRSPPPTGVGTYLESSWNVMGHGDSQEGKWRGNCWMEWLASTLHSTSEHGVSSITTADAHTSAASSRLNWRPYRFKWTRPFSWKTKSGFCACAITFQTRYTTLQVFTFQRP
jgi:hypothetical protein